jgi:hypothetical protein
VFGFNPFYNQSLSISRKLKESGKIYFPADQRHSTDQLRISDETKDLIIKLTN